MKKVVVASMIGNGLEWYDYALYGHLATLISFHFFPTANPFVSLIATFGVFAAGFAMRPLGAIIFGYIGDRYGRKVSLTSSILLMAIPTGLLGILPTYETIGIWAPILLTIIRLLQGIAIGGEFSGSIIYVVEHSPANKRGLAGSTSIMSLMIGVLLGSGVASLFAELMSKADFESYGWRIPFIIGFFIGIIGLYIRTFLDESETFKEAKELGHLSKKPLKDILSKKYRGKLLIGLGAYMAVTIPFYLLTVFMNSFMSKVLGYSVQDALLINTICMFVLLALLPFSAILSDKIGRKPVLVASSLAYIVFAYPIFYLVALNSFYMALLGVLLFAIVVSFYVAVIPTLLVEIFPTSIRYTGVSLACNVCAAIFGGTAPIIATWLVKATGHNTILAIYIAFSAVISLVALFYYKETYKVRLNGQ